MNANFLPTHGAHYGEFAVARSTMEYWWLNWSNLWQRRLMQWRVGSARVNKRAFDIVASLLFLIVFSPLYLLLAVLVKLDGGPAIFSQTRVGRHGEEFQMYKFRSMCPDAEARLAKLLSQNEHAEGVTFKMKKDPRVTRIGKWIRRFSLDELPQFINVLKGDMSLVGPRPPTPREVLRYSQGDRRRLAVKPGLTCFWQVSGRSNIDFAGQVKLDVQYIEQACFWVDVKLVFKTVSAVVNGHGAC